jgi:hypothetical protein
MNAREIGSRAQKRMTATRKSGIEKPRYRFGVEAARRPDGV